jgi:hypothetical protein
MFNRQNAGGRAVCLAAALLCCAGSRSVLPAQKTQSSAAPAAEQQSDVDAQRGALDRFLDSHPEIEGDILGAPQRITDPNYIHEHPELQAFLENHPLVKADPRAFIIAGSWRFPERRSDTHELLDYFVPFSVFLCMLLAILWVVRTLLENRRWNKTFKVHEDVHTKLIEKFASGQELTAYMQSDAGRRLLEWTPPSIEGRMPFAATRILWSLQAGLILALGGAGLLSVRQRIPEAAEPLLLFGVLGLTIGLGFLLSGIISYAVSKHLGLFAPGHKNGSQAGLAGEPLR